MTWHFPLEARSFFPGKKPVFPGAAACTDLSPDGHRFGVGSGQVTSTLHWRDKGGLASLSFRHPCGTLSLFPWPRWVGRTLWHPHSLDPSLRWLRVGIPLHVGAGRQGLLPWAGFKQRVCAVWLSVHREYPGVRTFSLFAGANTFKHGPCEEGMPQFTWHRYLWAWGPGLQLHHLKASIWETLF